MSAVSLGFAAFALVVADTWVAAPLVARMDYAWLIFEPGSARGYSTSEFDVTANINALGFRGGPTTRAKRTALRAIALGDSFTYGWGLNDNAAWPQVLEGLLRAEGLDVEVLNLGKPGATPAFYASLAESAVDTLDPDLVLVGLTQGDDFSSTGDPAATEWDSAERLQRVEHPASRVLRWALPHIATLVESRLRVPQRGDAAAIQARAQAVAADFLDSMPPAERSRFDGLDAEVKRRYVEGDLNPHLVKLAVKHPSFFTNVLHLDSDLSRQRVAWLAEYLSRIRATAAAAGAGTLAVSIPHGAYLHASTRDRVARLGLDVEPGMVGSGQPDAAYAESCARAGVELALATATFRTHPNPGLLYYPYDLHFTPAGARLFAEAIAPTVAAALRGH